MRAIKTVFEAFETFARRSSISTIGTALYQVPKRTLQILLSYIESKLIIIISSFRLSHVTFLGIDLWYRLVEFTGQIMRDTMCGKRGKITIRIERQNVFENQMICTKFDANSNVLKRSKMDRPCSTWRI